MPAIKNGGLPLSAARFAQAMRSFPGHPSSSPEYQVGHVGCKLKAAFFLRPNVAQISQDLLGKMLYTRVGRGPVTGGLIVETEAYGGITDRASHAFGGRRTKRTAVMFRRGGIAYVYLCYGLHYLFNIITNQVGIPDAVLIRAIQPLRGLDTMLARRRQTHLSKSLAAGPARLAAALGLHLQHNGCSLGGREIWLETGIAVRPAQIVAGPRIGVHYAGVDAQRPWRFGLRDNSWISRPFP